MIHNVICKDRGNQENQGACQHRQQDELQTAYRRDIFGHGPHIGALQRIGNPDILLLIDKCLSRVFTLFLMYTPFT